MIDLTQPLMMGYSGWTWMIILVIIIACIGAWCYKDSLMETIGMESDKETTVVEPTKQD
jgi:hypothetical protein